jgi:hypothetical protein
LCSFPCSTTKGGRGQVKLVVGFSIKQEAYEPHCSPESLHTFACSVHAMSFMHPSVENARRSTMSAEFHRVCYLRIHKTPVILVALRECRRLSTQGIREVSFAFFFLVRKYWCFFFSDWWDNSNNTKHFICVSTKNQFTLMLILLITVRLPFRNSKCSNFVDARLKQLFTSECKNYLNVCWVLQYTNEMYKIKPYFLIRISLWSGSSS